MASQAARQRKGASGPPKSGEALVQVSNAIVAQDFIRQHATDSTIPTAPRSPIVATVKRNKCGTGPFDKQWLNLDCCGLFCAIITYMLHLYGVYATCLILIPPWMSTVDQNGIRRISPMGHLTRTAFTFVSVLAIYAHFKAMTTDPGAVPPDAQPIPDMTTNSVECTGNNGDEETGNGDTSSEFVNGDPLFSRAAVPPPKKKGKRLCRRCNSFKPKRAHHCSICKRCIIKMDHHCPWVNNCVGIGNHKYFLLFVFYTCFSCIFSLTLIGIRIFDCMNRHGHIRTHHITCLDRPSQLLSILGLFIEAILFGLFTICMMIDQTGVVTTKMTHIDRLKGGEEALGSSLAGVVEVFGINPKKLDLADKFRADWLSPFHRICFPTSVHDEIMGFCRPCGGGGSTRSPSGNSDTEMTPMVRSIADIV